ncbi:hypothetical protein PG984_008473 [Apiospora sp. TS-2023a]
MVLDDDGAQACEKILALFAGIIGRENAQLIRHVTVSFPHVSQVNGITLSASWMTEPPTILELLASEYGHLETIETELGGASEIKGPGIDDPRMMDLLVRQIDGKARSSMPSLKNIIVNVYEYPSPYARLYVSDALLQAMTDRGWKLVICPW